MSRAELERRRIAEKRWPRLAIFVGAQLSQSFFLEVTQFNQAMRKALLDLPLADLKKIAAEAKDFMTFFQDRTDDVYFALDGLNATVPPGKIPYEGEDPGGVRRMKLLYAESMRLIREQEKGWQA